MSLNRRIVTAQIVMAFILLGGGLGLWSKYDTLQDNKRSLMPVLKGIRQDLNEIRHEENRWSESEKSFFYDSAVNLLDGMANINTNSLVSILYPSSWFDNVDSQIKHAMTLAYNKIILKSMLFGLQQKTDTLLAKIESYENAPALMSSSMVALERVPEFVELRQSLDEFKAIQTNGDLYNKLRSTHDLSALNEIIFYLFGVRLPPGFFQNAFFYHQSLKETDYVLFQPEVYREKAVPRIKKLFHRLHTKLFRESSLERQLQELAVQIDQLESGKSWSPETGLREFERTVALISQQQEFLANPDFAWIFRDKLALGIEFDKVMETVEKSGMLGKVLRVELEMSGEKAFQAFKKAVASKETSLTGPLLTRENEKLRAELSPGVFAVKTSFDKLLSQKFVNLGLQYKPLVTEITSGSRIVWDKKLLEEAASLSQLYEVFIRDGGRGLSPNLQKLMVRVARTRLEQSMLDLIAHAQNYKIMPKGAVFARLDADVGPDVLNFREALRQLGDIIDIFNQMDFIDSSWMLSSMLTSQASNMLKTVDRLLEDERLYEFKDGAFRWGNGVSQASLTAFEVRDIKELEYYLAIQRERIKHMARDYAEPLVRFLVDRTVIRGSGIEAMTAKWQRIFLELDRYEAQKAGNSLTILEKFILFDMDKITPINRCNDVTMKDMGDPSGDFFLQRLSRLRQMVYRQCAMRITNEALKEYTTVATYFNEKLAGRFPFAEVSDDPAFLEARPENIQEFFWILDNYVKTGKPLLEKAADFGLSGEKALDFVGKLEKVRNFFSPFLEKGKESNLPVYLLDVDFRVNRKVEVGANQIIDWNLDVGHQKYNLLDAKHFLRWTYGDPIVFSVRWAKDSPYQPIQYTTARAKVEDRTVLYQYTNRWSLISLLRNHESNPEDFERLVDPKPNTIKFVIGTVTEDKIARASRVPPEKTPETNQSKVFIRTTVLSPEKNDVKLMPEFPVKAPQLTVDPRS
jgi:type VI secretion system protein ImpL